MFTFTAVDGEQFSGETYDDVVIAMSKQKLEEPRSLETYRQATANRVHDTYGSEIRATSSEAFITDLCVEGLLVEEDE